MVKNMALGGTERAFVEKLWTTHVSFVDAQFPFDIVDKYLTSTSALVEIIWLNRAICVLNTALPYGGESIKLRLISLSYKDLESPKSKGLDASRATYSLKKLFLVDVAPVVLLFFVPLFAHAGFFNVIAGLFVNEMAAEERSIENIIDIPLLRAATNIDPNPAKGGGDVIVSDGALVADSGPLGGDDAVKARENGGGEISVYIVEPADTLSQIAEMFGVSVNTILWANDIKKATGIKEGDELIILPITGVRHVVKKGDTIASIANKYKGDAEDILAYNQLENAEAVVVGETIVIPGGEVEAPKVALKVGVRGPSGVAATAGYFTHPLPGAKKTQGIHGYNGVDLGGLPLGSAVYAAAAGEVVVSKSSGYNGGYGRYVVVKHDNGMQTLYAHLSSNSVVPGARVAQGQVIGGVGNTGRSTGIHLHVEVRGGKNPF